MRQALDSGSRVIERVLVDILRQCVKTIRKACVGIDQVFARIGIDQRDRIQ